MRWILQSQVGYNLWDVEGSILDLGVIVESLYHNLSKERRVLFLGLRTTFTQLESSSLRQARSNCDHVPEHTK